MSSHASTKIDQKEYLKKYLSGDKVKKKKKDKKRKKDFGAAKVKIIDDDATCNQTQDDFAEEILLGGDDAPQIVGEYIEEPSSDANAQKWRTIGVKEESIEESASKNKQPVDLWGAKQSKRKIKDEFSPVRSTNRQGTPDNSPPRRKHRESIQIQASGPDMKCRSSAYNSPPRRNNVLPQHDIAHSPIRLSGATARYSSSDQSPPRKHKHKSTKNRERSRSRSNEHNQRRRRNRDASTDQSPARSKDNRDSSVLPVKHTRRNSSDQSPPLRNGRSPKRNYKRGSSSDLSPPRGNRKTKKQSYLSIASRNSIEQSPPRRRKSREHSVSTMKNKRRNSSDQSPPRRNNRDPQMRANRSSSSDLSPPRSRKNKGHSMSPAKNNTKTTSNQSPPRRHNRATGRQRKRDSSSDLSPPRSRKNKKRSMSPVNKKRGNSSDQSPPRRQKNQDASLDLSPPRKKKHKKRSTSPKKRDGKNSSDLSPHMHHNTPPARIKREIFSPNQSPPPRRPDFIKREPSSPPPKQSRWSKLERRNSDSPPPTHKPKASKTLDGKKAGLQDAKSLTQETEERRQRENRMYNEMSKEISGRDAEVQVRTTGRKGKRAREAEAEDPEVRRRKDEHERKKKEKYDRWGKGLKQVEEHQQRREAELYEGSKPLARYEDDKDLDRYLREQERAEDPMLEYMRKKKKERQKDEGTVAETPKYEGTYPENRFGIRPGYRWDGVDRSNGFEKKWFDVQNEKRAKQEEAYLYSVEDM